MFSFREVKWQGIVAAATIALVWSAGARAQVATGITITINHNDKLSTFKSGPSGTFKEKGYEVSERGSSKSYRFLISRTAQTGLDDLGWYMPNQCAGFENKALRRVEGLVFVDKKGQIHLESG